MEVFDQRRKCWKDTVDIRMYLHVFGLDHLTKCFKNIDYLHHIAAENSTWNKHVLLIKYWVKHLLWNVFETYLLWVLWVKYFGSLDNVCCRKDISYCLWKKEKRKQIELAIWLHLLHQDVSNAAYTSRMWGEWTTVHKLQYDAKYIGQWWGYQGQGEGRANTG